jgi:hypothetical protein
MCHLATLLLTEPFKQFFYRIVFGKFFRLPQKFLLRRQDGVGLERGGQDGPVGDVPVEEGGGECAAHLHAQSKADLHRLINFLSTSKRQLDEHFFCSKATTFGC